MHLTAKQYQWRNFDDEKADKKKNKSINKLCRVGKLDIGRPQYIEWEFAYWRKANHIHKWFVDNVQDGKDECQSTYVTIEKIKELLELCKEVSQDHELATELLPIHSGFFFGGEEYDEYYFQQIEYTIERLEYLFKNEEEFKTIEFYYRSSW